VEERRALFRFDAGAEIGGGHAVRCLTLAVALEADGWTCRFAVTPETLETVPTLAARASDCVALDEMSTDGPYEALIVDHYDWDAGRETPCRDFARHIIVIDDLADRPHDCDIVIDQGLGRLPENYAGLVPDHCRYLLGPVHGLLKPEFATLRDMAVARRESGTLKTVLIAFGLTDPENLTARALQGLASTGLAVEAVLGAAAPHLNAVKAAAATLDPPARVIVNADDMAARMAAADLGIGACGTTSWERCALGLPTLAVIAADNQRANAAALTAAGAVTLLGWHADVNAADFTDHVDANSELPAQAAAAARLCDGRGTARVVGALNDLIDGVTPALRPATMADAELLLSWRNDEETRRQSKTTEAVAYTDHVNWLRSVLDDSNRRLSVAMLADQPVGSVRADKDGGAWVLSWIVAPAARGKGQGRRIVARMVESLAGEIHAEVKPSNPASARIAQAVGMSPMGAHDGLTLWAMQK